MRVHSLNCATLQPLVVGRLVCHVLLCESAQGLVLVDTGLAELDLAHPARRLGPARALLRPAYDPAETAWAQVRALGFAAEDVRHVVLTHLDLDHVGGLADFPAARVHTTDAELAAAQAPPRRERGRYRPAQWSHRPRWETYEGPGEPWQGIPGAHALRGLDAGIALVPMPGHSRGHAAVGVDAGERGLLLHAGDAFFDRSTVHPAAPRKRALRVHEQVVAHDRRRVADSHARLAELAAGDEVEVICAHDPDLFDAAVARR